LVSVIYFFIQRARILISFMCNGISGIIGWKLSEFLVVSSQIDLSIQTKYYWKVWLWWV